MDIKPPKTWKRPSHPAPQRPQVVVPVSAAPLQSVPRPQAVAPSAPQSVSPSNQQVIQEESPTQGFKISASKNNGHRWLKVCLSAIGILIGLVVFAGLIWFGWAIGPRSSSSVKQPFVVTAGESPSIISQHLESQGLIRNAFAFELYTKLHNISNRLQAGGYKLAPNQSVESIAEVLTKGQDTVYDVFIPPGMTLKQLADPTVKNSFAAQGFSVEEINQAFSAQYTSPLLKDKPASASLEGYIFPETFQVKEGDSLKSVLERSFDELYARLQKDGMLDKFSAEGLTLHQALTLGSMVQKEVSDATVQPQVAQVFLLRLKEGMALGSDVTFIYAAHQLGVTPDPALDSPYNTRIHTGLPPGPIATMNYSALQAVATPASGDYLFFVAGDDGTVHFSHTDAEHQQQVQQYCQKLCNAPL